MATKKKVTKKKKSTTRVAKPTEEREVAISFITTTALSVADLEKDGALQVLCWTDDTDEDLYVTNVQVSE